MAIPVAAGIGMVVIGFRTRVYYIVFVGFLMIFVSLCCGLPYLYKFCGSPVEEEQRAPAAELQIGAPEQGGIIIQIPVEAAFRIQERNRRALEQGEIIIRFPVASSSEPV